MSRRHHDEEPATPPPPPRDRCGRCSDAGLVPVAVHTLDEVRVYHVHCACSLGRHWATRRAPPDGTPVPTPHEFAERARRWVGVRAVYPHATPGQKRLDLREPDASAEDRARVQAIVNYVREGRGMAPLHDDDSAGRW